MTTEWMRPRTPKSIAGLAAVAAAVGALWVSSLAAQDDAKKPAVPEVLATVNGQAIDRDAVIEGSERVARRTSRRSASSASRPPIATSTRR